jgi:DNA polymerase III delta subunit
MKLDEYRRILADLSLRPVLLIVGPEPYLRKELVETLRRRGVKEHGEGFVCHTFYAQSHPVREVLTTCRAGEFFVTCKLVLLHDVQRCGKGDLSALTDYVKAPDPSTSLVMTAESVDGRTTFAKAVAKAPGGRIDLKPMYESEMPAWIEAFAKRRGKRTRRAASEALAELCGTNLDALAAELEKLEIYTAGRDTIEEADVAAVVGSSRTETYYRLRDAILEGRAGEALEIWGLLVEAGENTYALFGRLRATLRELLGAKEMAERGTGMTEIGRALGIPAWRLRPLGAVLAKADLARLRRDLLLLFEADLALRQSRLTERQVAEGLLVSLCAA